MSLRLLITSGQGPVECRQAVAHVLRLMADQAAVRGLELDCVLRGPELAPESAIIVVHGLGAAQFFDLWHGTIQWTAPSTHRPGHARKSWFIGVFELLPVQGAIDLNPADLRVETCRAGGPGGQHVNTTDSAVRLVHIPTGTAVIARDGRSQIQNRKVALARLTDLMALRGQVLQAAALRGENRLHHAVQRGNPKRRFIGPQFDEVF